MLEEYKELENSDKKTKKANRHRIMVQILVPLVLALLFCGIYFWMNRTQGDSYATFIKKVHADTQVVQDKYEVISKEKISNSNKKNSDKKYKYELKSLRTEKTYEITSSKNTKKKKIDGLTYMFKITYPSIDAEYADCYYTSDELGNSFTSKEFQKFQQGNYEKEIKEYYNKYVK